MTNTTNFWAGRLARGIALKAIAVIGLSTGTALADEQSPQYTMTVFSNQSFSGKVLKGEYEAAIDRITAGRVPKRKRLASLTNLCVAYTKVGELEQADEACNAAVALVEQRRDKRSRATHSPADIEAADRADLAVALSNRGVYFAAKGEKQRAQADFEASLELDAGLSAPEINLARLDSSTRRLY
ncbi:MAG: hypothetical protein AAFX10_05250 [Pseudomonadota bacterium]